MEQPLLTPQIYLLSFHSNISFENMRKRQKHIRAAKARTANFSVKNEGDINLFEMSVELNGDNTQKQQRVQR